MDISNAKVALICLVATAPTVYGIETEKKTLAILENIKLQQHLPFTVLKPVVFTVYFLNTTELQQPFTVLKRDPKAPRLKYTVYVATAPTVYGIETTLVRPQQLLYWLFCCNSTYRLRYAPQSTIN